MGGSGKSHLFARLRRDVGDTILYAYAPNPPLQPATLEDVTRAARPVLRHRIIPNYNATGEGITVEQIIAHLLPKLQA